MMNEVETKGLSDLHSYCVPKFFRLSELSVVTISSDNQGSTVLPKVPISAAGAAIKSSRLLMVKRP
ncbi:hypothetical protein M514_21014 [Trichuris suis]|uniref:Uncharacterized protein n=1 Tax=Trichuris suis TaxID=68888 RepID=A0A085NBM4_9BILA|nr:hypothetical protein M514_21014 [Trichuris suis]